MKKFNYIDWVTKNKYSKDAEKYLAEGKLLKEEMSLEDVYVFAQQQMKDIYNLDIPMDIVKQKDDHYLKHLQYYFHYNYLIVYMLN